MINIRTIVVHVDDSDRCEARVTWASVLARELGARLIGMYLTPDIPLAPSVAALLPKDVVDSRLRETGAAQKCAETRFRRLSVDAGLLSSEWRAPADDALTAAVAHARCADWFVVGQPDPADPQTAFAGALAESVIFSSGHPTLIVPYVGASPGVPRNILVAWDGGREASRAIADALPLLVSAARVTVVSIRTDADNEVVDTQTESRLAAYLHAHEVHAEFKHYEHPEGDVGGVLLSRAADFGCELIVMGAYGHARIREWALGGATRTLLKSMTVPVLMSH